MLSSQRLSQLASGYIIIPYFTDSVLTQGGIERKAMGNKPSPEPNTGSKFAIDY